MEHQENPNAKAGARGGLLKRLLWSVVRIAVMVFAGALMIGIFFQDRLIYYPSRTIGQTPADVGLGYQDVALATSDGVKISAWYVPAAVKGAKTIIFCHGNGGNIGDRLEKLAMFYGLGQNCLIFDYRGYGKSAGKPNEKGTYLDAAAAYDWLRNTRSVPIGDIVAYGESLGGAVAAHLASDRECGGLILDSTFTSVADVGARVYPFLPVRWIVGKKYDTTAVIGKVKCPVLMIHSRDDEIVPFELGQELFRKANKPKKFVEISGGHNDGFITSEEAYRKGLSDWFNGLVR